jgi:hypothetical protein
MRVVLLVAIVLAAFILTSGFRWWLKARWARQDAESKP